MYAKEISFTDITDIMNKNHTVYNKSALQKAHEYATEKHAGTFRGTKEAYIMHPRRVAKIIAEWGFESEMVIAALLHDIVEDTETPLEEIVSLFGTEVADMVDTVTKLNKRLKEYRKLTKKERLALSDAKFQQQISDKALYIKLADRLDNLHTIEGMPAEKRPGKAAHTRDILIPMALQEEAFMIVDELEELCFKIEHENHYNAILNKFEEYKESNLYGFNKTLSLFRALFDRSIDSAIPRDLLPYQKYISSFAFNKRSFVSIFRQISREAKNMKNDFEALIRKDNIAWYDFTLIISDSSNFKSTVASPIDVFFKFYEDVLLPKGIYLLKTCRTTYNESSYILLCDSMGNLFRLFVKTESEYTRFKLGKIVDSFDNLYFHDVNDIDPHDTYKEKIKVFKRNGAACYIDAGATVLDLAFLIHSEIGFHFLYALIDDSLVQYPAYHRLNAGDTVTIVTSEDETAKIQWFNYLKTSKATYRLYRYFSNPKNLQIALDNAIKEAEKEV